MRPLDTIAADLRDKVLLAPRRGRRRVVAIAGPPASGKSSIADCLANTLCKAGCPAQVVPMDGFHLDNEVLVARDLLHRKGAPDTFDAVGMLRLAGKLADTDNVAFPEFDRGRDISIADASFIKPETDTVIVEGNYLLMDMPVWRELAQYWDLSIAIKVDETTLRNRLVERWKTHGLSRPAAEARVEGNDLLNAQSVMKLSVSADVWI